MSESSLPNLRAAEKFQLVTDIILHMVPKPHEVEERQTGGQAMS